jgi:hypothetical protein
LGVHEERNFSGGEERRVEIPIMIFDRATRLAIIDRIPDSAPAWFARI